MWQVLPSRMNCSVHFCFLLQTLHKLKDGFTLLAIFSMLNSSVVEIAKKIKEEMIKKRRDRQRGREKRVRYTEILSFSADRRDSFESLFIISLCSSSFPLCSIYMLLLRLIQPSGCLLHFVTSQPGDGTLGWWGRFFFLLLSPFLYRHLNLFSAHSSVGYTKASSIDPIKLVALPWQSSESPHPNLAFEHAQLKAC